jgi:ABC-type lipoprotein release transport system permease subunit
MVLAKGGLRLALGVTGSLLAARVIESLFFGAAPQQPVTLAVVAALMAAIGLAACWIPALRAARIDPGIAIREQ